MLHVIGGVNVSGNSTAPGASVPVESIKISSAINNPMATATLQLWETTPSLSIAPQQTYVCIDETGQTNPTHNFVINGHLDAPVANSWYVATNTGVTRSDLSPGVQFVASNASAGSAYIWQNIQAGYIVPGVQYMLSFYTNIPGTITNGNNIAQITWLDAVGNTLPPVVSDIARTSTNGLIRVSISGVAPANTVSAQVVFGIGGSNATGTVQYFGIQLEPMWFTNEGITYPTPFCGPAQAATTFTDTFVRANQNGWGVASDGESWTFTGAANANSISNNEGVIAASGGGDVHAQLGSQTLQNPLITCRIAINSSGDIAGIQGRFSSASGTTCYKLLWYSGNIHINKAVNGTNTQLISTAFTMTPGTFYWFKLQINGSAIYGKIWQDGTLEPGSWTVSATDTSITGAGGFAVLGNTSNGAGCQYDHFTATDPSAISGTGQILPDSTYVRQTRVFAGFVTKCEAQYQGKTKVWTITAASNSFLLETQFLVNTAYQSMNDSAIITSAIAANFTVSANYAYTGLQNTVYQTITTNNVITGVFIDYLSPTDQTMKDLVQTLVNQSGYYFYVDNYFDLHYAPPGAQLASFGLFGNDPVNQPNSSPTDGSLPTYPYYNYKWTLDGSQVKNRIKVFGGKFIAPAITDSFTGNGSTKDFTLSQQPYNVSSVTVGGVAQKTGVYGVNTLGQNGYTATYDKAGTKLHLQTAPGNGVSVQVTYTYEANVIVRESALNSIAKFSNRISDSKINDTSLNSVTAALQRALAELVEYSDNRVIVQLVTQQALAAGQSVQLTSTWDNLTKVPMLVQKVDLSAKGSGIYEYACELGSYNPDLVSILVNIHKALLRNPTTAGQAIVADNVSAIDTIYLSEKLIVTPVGTASSSTYGTGVYGTTGWS